MLCFRSLAVTWTTDQNHIIDRAHSSSRTHGLVLATGTDLVTPRYDQLPGTVRA